MADNRSYYIHLRVQTIPIPKESGLGSFLAEEPWDGVSASATTGKITVKWSSTSGATKYTVYRSQTSGSTGSAIASGITSTSYADSSVTKGVKYYYIVTAGNASGYGPNSSQVNTTAK